MDRAEEQVPAIMITGGPSPAAVFRGISFSSAMRLISADLVRVCLTGLIAGEAAFGAFLTAAL